MGQKSMVQHDVMASIGGSCSFTSIGLEMGY